MDLRSLAPYIAYIQTMQAHNIERDAIYKDLVTRGVHTQTAEWMIQYVESLPIEQGSVAPNEVVAQKLTRQQQPTELQEKIPKSKNKTLAHKSGMKRGFITAGLLCIIPSLVIAFDKPFATRFGTAPHTLMTLGDITGVIGLLLVIFDLLLSTRMHWLEDLFGGLNKVYIAHAIFGVTSLCAILVHPVLIAIRYLPMGPHEVARWFVPTTSYMPATFGILALFTMLFLLVLTLYVKLPYRIWLITHKFLGLSYILMCAHVFLAKNGITDNLFIRWYLILFMVAGLAAFAYRTLFPNILVRRYAYQIAIVRGKPGGAIEIIMRPKGREMNFTAGQFVFIAFPGDGLSHEAHPFTISSAPADGSFSVTVKPLGDYTTMITKIVPHLVGTTVRVEGAYGRFSFRNYKNINQVWIAGGIGITPFLSMAQSLGTRPCNIDLYYTARSESDLIDIQLLAQYQSVRPGQVFRVIPFVTNTHKQHLTADIIQATTGDIQERDFLMCGPNSMMKEMTRQLLAQGVPKYRVHSEEFQIL